MMQVVPLTKSVCDTFVKQKHYSRRAPIFWAGFGLVEYGEVQGVCVFGQPSPTIQTSAFRERDFRLFELARLVVQTRTKNASSFLVGGALRMLEPRPCAVVSYADSAHGHCGYIYQATNWVYTGAVVAHECMYMVEGIETHAMTLYQKGITDPIRWARENGIETVRPKPKHRYFYACGKPKDKVRILAALTYPIVTEYPKAEAARYDDGPLLHIPYTPPPSSLF